jgi:hypothetical protein
MAAHLAFEALQRLQCEAEFIRNSTSETTSLGVCLSASAKCDAPHCAKQFDFSQQRDPTTLNGIKQCLKQDEKLSRLH